MSSISHNKAVEQSFELLFRCMMQSKHRLTEIGSELSLTQMQAMMILMLDEPKPMNKLTKVFNCDASNITGIVDGLEKKYLAARFPAANDRRIKMVKLSAKGETIRTKLLKQLVNGQGSILFKLSPDELNTLVPLLQKITDNDS